MEQEHLSPFFLEWRIENFSCWMTEGPHGHGVRITCCSIHNNFAPDKIRLSLYRPSGDTGPMEITYDGPNIIFSEKGYLSFLSSDGFSLCTRGVSEVLAGNPNRVDGPKFQDVVSRIEQNEELHGDHLTLQFRYEKPREHRIFMRTTLDVSSANLQITLPIPLHSGLSYVLLASIPYHNGVNDHEAQMHVIYNRQSKELHLTSTNAKKSISVKCHISVFDRSKDLVTYKKIQKTIPLSELRHFKFHPASCTVLDLMPALDSGGHSILRLKIINGNYSSHSFYFFGSTSPLENAYKNTLEESNSYFSLREDLRCLYQEREFPDFQIKCGPVSFPVHRSILIARSPVFRAMLSSNMREAASGSMDIEDLDPTSLELFLAFLYTGSFKDVPCDSALRLYYAADKYQVPSLKSECVDVLCANVCISNVCRILSLGDRHEDDRLTSAAQNFILKNYREVSGSEEWQDHMKTDSHLLLKTVTHFGVQGYLCHNS